MTPKPPAWGSENRMPLGRRLDGKKTTAGKGGGDIVGNKVLALGPRRTWRRHKKGEFHQDWQGRGRASQEKPLPGVVT